MKTKNFLIITALLGIVHVTVFGKPPTFLWHSSNCWANSVLQFLRQIKPATEKILQRYKDGTLGNNAFLKAYAERLLDPRNETKSENLTEALTGRRKGPGGQTVFFKKITQDPDVKKIFWPHIGFSRRRTQAWKDYQFEVTKETIQKSNASRKEKTKYKKGRKKNIEKSLAIQDAVPWFGSKKTKPNFLEVTRASNYTIMLPMGIEIEETIDLSKRNEFVLSAKLKEKSDDWTYDLIGIIDFYEAKEVSNSHFKSYVKNQFEKKPVWYYCPGVNNDCRTTNKLPKKIDHSMGLLLYKKRKPDLDWSKKDSASADIQSLADALHTLSLH